MKTRVKFCGMTRMQDVKFAIALNVDALGFVFVKSSPRNIDVETAAKIFKEIPPFIVKVGLFMNAKASEVENVLQKIRINLLQFHGDEEEQFCNQFEVPYLKAVPMGSVSSLDEYCQDYPSATGFLLDSHAKGEMGGSGEKFSWEKLPQGIDKPIILAGGLRPDNVAEAIRTVHPYAVDVSSGIETSKGIKDPAKMEQFIKEVHRDQDCITTRSR